MSGDDIEDGMEYETAYVASDSEGEVTVCTNDGESVTSVLETESHNAKKRKKGGSKLQEMKRIKMEVDIEQKKNLSKEHDTALIADILNKRIAHQNRDLSTLELTGLYFDKTDIRLTADICSQDRSLNNLVPFIMQKFSNMLTTDVTKSKLKAKKTTKVTNETYGNSAERKFVAIVSMSAIRACDVHRSTKDVNGSSLKLINKNKIDFDRKLVKSTRSRVLCCTPGRLAKVLNSENKELLPNEIKIVIVDNSYLNSKCQNIWDIAETTSVLKSLTKTGSKLYFY